MEKANPELATLLPLGNSTPKKAKRVRPQSSSRMSNAKGSTPGVAALVREKLGIKEVA